MANNYGRFIITIITICVLSGVIAGGLAYHYCYQVPITEPALSHSASLLTDSPQETVPATPTIPIINTASINDTKANIIKEAPAKSVPAKKISRKKKPITREQSKQTVSTASMPNPATTDIQHTHDSNNTKNTRTVTIHNNITKNMLTYSHWTGKYKPTTFSISINENPLEPEQTYTVPILNNKITIFYRYSFMNGYRTGARNITFSVDPDANSLSLTFSWKNKWHVLLDHASPEEAEEVPFKE